MIGFRISARRPALALAVLALAPACGEREAPPPPTVDVVPTPVPADSASLRPDTLEGDSLMARDTLWGPQP